MLYKELSQIKLSFCHFFFKSKHLELVLSFNGLSPLHIKILRFLTLSSTNPDLSRRTYLHLTASSRTLTLLLSLPIINTAVKLMLNALSTSGQDLNCRELGRIRCLEEKIIVQGCVIGILVLWWNVSVNTDLKLYIYIYQTFCMGLLTVQFTPIVKPGY